MCSRDDDPSEIEIRLCGSIWNGPRARFTCDLPANHYNHHQDMTTNAPVAYAWANIDGVTIGTERMVRKGSAHL